ncbi:DNA-directed RNA polymerase subunit alpha C-terminal domain-containing protein [Tautonia sociabilis]|uniref:Tetratricopeptide repeat protein n=1 Tax=Tautonia sociabilis TaxID=2080755 RepID=A0A432MNB7_9BACT|nr:DNA-directed RNA polymerase subunit alpha C-terminal domain-containing protein [Tautonia sociabilis]RUL88931.1 tetratricopeptide repeat protein [Tautonia sociabilis]
MSEQMTSDVRALMDRDPFDLSTVADLRELLGRDPSRYGTLREAVQNIKDRHKGAPLGPDVRLRLGVAEVLHGHYHQALEHLEQAGDSGMAHFHRGLALENLQRWEEAADAFAAAGESGYDPKLATLHRAGALRRAGKTDLARSLLKKLEGQAEGTAEYHYQRGCLLADEGEQILAAEAFEKALSLNRDHTGALFQLAYINDLYGNDEAAIEYYEQCLRHPPVPLAALINLGILREDEQRYREAEGFYNQVLSHLGNEPRARLYAKDCRASRDMYYDESLEKQYDRLRTLLEIPVTDFELSVRSRNCLRKMNIRTLGDLTRTTEAALLASKNFGETSLAEIKQIMETKGLRLGMALEAGERGGIGSPMGRSGHAPAVPMGPATVEISPEERATLAKPISELNLSVRSRKCMAKLNIQTIGDLVTRTGDDLLECKNFGVTSLNEVREKLAEMGLKLRND